MKQTLSAAAMLLASAAFAATSNTWETGTPADLLKGRLHGLSMTADGSLRPGPALGLDAAVDQPVLWSLAAAPDGGVYVSTGHRGRIYRIDKSGKPALVWSAEQPEVFALCVDGQGQLYAATSPNGGIYRIENGKGVQVARIAAKYIWALAAAPDGSLFAGTGDHGQIFHVEKSGAAQVYFETGQANVTSLNVGPNGHLYAGSEPNGLLYEITAQKTGSVLYDSSLPEIHSIAVKADGTVFAAGLGGSLASRTTTPNSTITGAGASVVSGGTTVISVSEAKQNGPESTPEQSADIKPGSKASVTSTITPTVTPSTPTFVDVSGVEKSAIYRISPNGAVETLRSSKDDNVYDLLLSGDNLLFATDVRGRIYSMTPDRKQTLLIETGDGEATRLLKTSLGTWAGISNPAKAVLIDGSPVKSAFYESVVHDAASLSRWGRLAWEENGTGILFRTRSGNSARPDSTWSAWSDPITAKENALITSPRARYVQWRAEWSNSPNAELESVTVPFLMQNTQPVVRSIMVNSVALTSGAKTTAPASSSSAYTVTVTDTGDASSASSSSNQTQTLARQNAAQTLISWQADDPEGDKLIYSLYFKGDGESEWKALKKNIYENTIVLDQDALADGKYWFRVVASDRPSNDVRYAQQSELVSMSFIIDNTPPAISITRSERKGSSLIVAVLAEDKTTALKRCEYSVDAGPWQPVEAEDGITDSLRENFQVNVPGSAAGEHLIVFRVYDSAGNVGLAKTVVH